MPMLRRIGKTGVKAADRIVDYIILILLLLLCFIGVYAIIDNHIIYEKASSTSYEIYRPNTPEGAALFQRLTYDNPDVFSWLTVDDTNINYPVVQGKDNVTYLDRGPTGEYSFSGSLFLDYENSKDFTDFNSFIFGHHMEGSHMFGTLKLFQDKAYFEKHKTGTLYYNGETHNVLFFVFLNANAYDNNLYRLVRSDVVEMEKYLAYLHKRAVCYRDIGITINDRLLVLSTCSSTRTNGRQLLVGKIGEVISKQEVASLVTPEKVNPNPAAKIQGIDASAGSKRLAFNLLKQMWFWILIILILIIISFLFLLKKKRRKREEKI